MGGSSGRRKTELLLPLPLCRGFVFAHRGRGRVTMPLPDWKEVVKTDFPEMGPITAGTKERIQEHRRCFRGGVRISTGRIWEDEEYEQRRTRVLSTPLP